MPSCQKGDSLNHQNQRKSSKYGETTKSINSMSDKIGRDSNGNRCSRAIIGREINDAWENYINVTVHEGWRSSTISEADTRRSRLIELVLGLRSDRKRKETQFRTSMGGALVFVEPNNPTKAKKDTNIWNLLNEGGVSTFIERCSGHDPRLTEMIVRSWDNGKCRIHGKEVNFSNESIEQATGLPNWGRLVKRNSRMSKIDDINKFKQGGIELVSYKFGFLRSSLPYPWYKLCKVIMRYITLDGRHMEVYGHHIILLNHSRFVEEKVNVADFVIFFMEVLVSKCKKKPEAIPLHQSVMLLVYKQVLANQVHTSVVKETEREIEDEAPLRFRRWTSQRLSQKRNKEQSRQPAETRRTSQRLSQRRNKEQSRHPAETSNTEAKKTTPGLTEAKEVRQE